VSGPTQRPLPDNTQHSQEKNFPCPRGIRTRNPTKRAAADSHLRPRGHCDRRNFILNSKISRVGILDFCLVRLIKDFCVLTFSLLSIIIIIIMGRVAQSV